MRNAVLAALILLDGRWAVAAESSQRTLSFADRVKAQEAIERVYYAHQIGTTAPFEAAVPRAVLENKVRKVLDQTAALKVYWKTAVTDEMLERELLRMASGTRMPERLSELYSALGNDPFLVKECLARAILVDRLTHNFYAFDPTLHAEERRRADELHRQLASGELSPLAEHVNRSVVEYVETLDSATVPPKRETSFRRELAPDDFRNQRAELPEGVGQVSVVEEAHDEFVFTAVLSETPREVRVASYAIPKRSWDDWWDSAKLPLRTESVPAVATDRDRLPVPTTDLSSVLPCGLDDTWTPTSTAAPRGRSSHSAVWTGDLMLVWGEDGSPSQPRNGGRYDPATDTWRLTSTTGAPSSRDHHSAVWTGSLMIVWGGDDRENTFFFNDGGRYDPATDSWTPMSTTGAPSARRQHTAVWTGSLMVVWGGFGNCGDHCSDTTNTGGRYDPATDTWMPTSTTGAPSARQFHTALWTGSLMLVWGGEYRNSQSPFETIYLNNGGRYDPATDSWTPTSTTGAPSARSRHTAVWTGQRMIVWGGYGGSYSDTGARYDPAAGTWTAMSTTGAPSARSRHTAVWTGQRMIVWGGDAGPSNWYGTGGRYDPATDTWNPTSTTGAPAERSLHTAVWTGSLMVVWGGANAGGNLNTGGRYDPATDGWTPTATTGAPIGVESHTAVWTGNLMLVWGAPGCCTADSGGRYDPATDAWSSIATTGAPLLGNSSHTAVWTGSQMVLWGGSSESTGGRYDPATDTWTPVSTTNAPSARYGHTAVWTGSLMLIWGGYLHNNDDSYSYFSSGGRYDPATDAWSPTSMTGAAAGRSGHTAAWTGISMVVWGGSYYTGSANIYLSTGGRYDPATDTWNATSTTGVPTGRIDHSSVWTGSMMVVWGGDFCDTQTCTAVGSGGRYDPATDTWTPTSTTGAPSARYSHTAVWTGSQMVVWGGFSPNTYTNTGGRYNLASDTWTPTATTNAPAGRAAHSVVWTGTEMIVWGGQDGSSRPLDTGGRYAVAPSTDGDGDGATVCQGDCNDANPSIYPAAPESCDGLDNNCNGPVDEDASGVDSDSDGVHNACDNCKLDWNAAQSDFDHDNQGDTCDLDDGLIYVYSTDKNYRAWQAESGYTTWNSYRGSLLVLRATGRYTQAPGSNPLAAHDCGVSNPPVFDPLVPDPGEVAFNLVTGVSGGVESSLGTNSAGVTRANANPCP